MKWYCSRHRAGIAVGPILGCVGASGRGGECVHGERRPARDCPRAHLAVHGHGEVNAQERMGQVRRGVHMPAQGHAVGLEVQVQALERHDVVVQAHPKVAGHSIRVQAGAVHNVARLHLPRRRRDAPCPRGRPRLGCNVAGAAADVNSGLNRVVNQRRHDFPRVWGPPRSQGTPLPGPLTSLPAHSAHAPADAVVGDHSATSCVRARGSSSWASAAVTICPATAVSRAPAGTPCGAAGPPQPHLDINAIPQASLVQRVDAVDELLPLSHDHLAALVHPKPTRLAVLARPRVAIAGKPCFHCGPGTRSGRL